MFTLSMTFTQEALSDFSQAGNINIRMCYKQELYFMRGNLLMKK